MSWHDDVEASAIKDEMLNWIGRPGDPMVIDLPIPTTLDIESYPIKEYLLITLSLFQIVLKMSLTCVDYASMYF